MERNQRIIEIFNWLGRDFSYKDEGAPNTRWMIRALDELMLNCEENGNLKKANYLRIQRFFYSGTAELTEFMSLNELRKKREAEIAKFSPTERMEIQWEVATAYYMEEMYEYACHLLHHGNFNEGIALLDFLIDEGHYNSALARAYYCIYAEEYLEALVRLKKLVNRRPSETAYLLLGDLYLPGTEKTGDYDIACSYYEEAANMGSVLAMHNVANLNFYGKVCDSSFSKASLLYEQAAEKGNSDSAYMSGVCHLFREHSGDSYKPKEDFQMWNKGIERLKSSQNPQSKPLLHYAKRRIPHCENPKPLRLSELYKMLCEDDKNKQYIYRGQTRIYPSPLRPSAYRNCRYSRYAMLGELSCQIRNWGHEFYLENTDCDVLKADKKAHIVKRIMSQHVNNALGYPLAQAFFQQAGYSSEGLDVSYDLNIALFFALYEYKNNKYIEKNFGKSQCPSVLYRWKLPENNISLHDNYYSKAHFIPTYDIFHSFSTCDSVEESKASLEEYLRAIRWGSIDFDLPQRRPFELLKVPYKSRSERRIAKQKGALLIPDVIQGYGEQRQHIAWGYSLNKITDLEFRLVQDLSDSSICDTFLIDCSNPEDSDFKKLGLNLPVPNEIYDSTKEDITHILTHNIFERAYQERMQLMGTSFIELNPAMPGYEVSYQEALQQLNNWNQAHDKCDYFFV